MTSYTATAAPPPGVGRGLVRWVCTSNPFYAVSAALFLVGLRVSFGAHARAIDTWALMSGLAGYTLLLAAAALLLVRFAGVWDDLRTVLLLVVLMFLATSVTFDELLALDPVRGSFFYLGGLLFAVGVTEGLLRGIRLRLPAWFRGPYYLILALYFLYPLMLAPLLGRPHSEALMWGLFGFSPAAGLAFLALLPAVRRGPSYLRGNGSPWPWPYYPWALFVILALAVPARAFLLCWSLHLLDAGDFDRLIFGPYFLIPFGLALAVLLLEVGVVARSRVVLGVALAAPAGLVALALADRRGDPIFEEFLGIFAARLGGHPLFLTLLAAAGFYAYAALRRVPRSAEALTAALLALALVGPETRTLRELVAPRPEFVLAAALLQLALGVRRSDAGRCLIGGLGLAAAAALAVPGEPVLRVLIGLHLGLLAVLAVGAAFDNPLGRALRVGGAVVMLAACLAVAFGRAPMPAEVPPWAGAAYPLALAVLLAGYAWRIGYRPGLLLAGLALSGCLIAAVWRGYAVLHEEVPGLDYLAVSLAFFAVAVLVSLGKSGVLTRWVLAWRGQVPEEVV